MIVYHFPTLIGALILKRVLISKSCIITSVRNISYSPEIKSLNKKLRSVATMSVVRKELIKSPEDDREYRGLILSNGIKAVLVSDPSTDKSAAALDVNVGSLSDPNELPGLVRIIRKSRRQACVYLPCICVYSLYAYS